MNRTRKLEPKKRRGSDGLWESWAASEFAEETAKMAIATGGFEETVPAASTSTTDVQSKTGGVPTAPQHPSWTLPSKKPQFAHAATAARELKKGRNVRTLQEQEFWTPFTDLETPDLLAAFDVPESQPPKKKTPGIAALVLDKRSSLGVPITKTAIEQKLATLSLADGSGELASSVRRVTRKQESSTPVATSSSKHVPLVHRAHPRASAVSGNQAAVKDSIESFGPDLDQIKESSEALASTASPALEDTRLDSMFDVSFLRSGGLPPTSPFAPLLGARTPKSPLALEGAAPDTLLPASANGLSPASPLALEDTGSAPSPAIDFEQSSSLASTLSPAGASPPNVDSGESSSTTAEPVTFRIFDLPQELQDAIFEFAYTEPGYENVYKREWEVRQTHIRETTEMPRADFPTHKVNEWMVSKRYFRAAAKAWMEAQTGYDYVSRYIKGLVSDDFPTISHTLGDGGLFLEFARTLVIPLKEPIGWLDIQQISRCRRLNVLACVVDEDFFIETDRGFAWEVELTKEELQDSLKRVNFMLPPGVVWVISTHFTAKKYANTPARLAMFIVNVEKLQTVITRRRGVPRLKVHAVTPNDDERLYLGSQIPRGARWMDPESPPKQVVGSQVHPDVRATWKRILNRFSEK
jgi:hypothetical protein